MLLALTFAAGSVDAISFLGLGHVFTAMMTGNTVLLGLALAQGEVRAALRNILALVGFSAGAFVSAMIVERDSKPTEWPAAVTGALALEAVVLAIFSVAYSFGASERAESTTLLLILLSSLAMGIQSAAVRRIGVPGIATTYITGTITSLMVDLLGWLRSMAAPLPVPKTSGDGPAEKSPSIPWEQRVGLLAGVVGLYCVGALAGGVLLARSSPLATLLPLAALLVVVLNAVIRQRHDHRAND